MENPMPPAARAFDGPLEKLQACHGRIEAELARLEPLVPHLEAHGCDAAAREAAREVMRYFDTAGRMHHQDEDEDLFPLLRELAADQQRHEIAAAIDELEREHATMHAMWGRLRGGLDAVAHGEGRLDAEEVARFAWLYRRHMEQEAAAVLPFARHALSGEQLGALAARMAARRRIQA